jgi:hypothetical protein
MPRIIRAIINVPWPAWPSACPGSRVPVAGYRCVVIGNPQRFRQIAELGVQRALHECAGDREVQPGRDEPYLEYCGQRRPALVSKVAPELIAAGPPRRGTVARPL